MIIPDEIMAILAMHCEMQNNGMFTLGNEEVTVIAMGKKNFSPDQVAISIAAMLLNNVIEGELAVSNREAREKAAKETKQ